MDSTELVRPDAVVSRTGDTSKGVNQAWNALNPCPQCGAVPHDAPEGTTVAGDPRWNFEHCWKCGFRPGVNAATDMALLRQQFEAFQQFQAESMPADRTLSPPSSDEEVQRLQAELAAVQEQLAQRNTTDNPQPFNPFAGQ